MATEFTTQTEILSDLWMNYRNEPNFDDFITYNDLGLPLAYAATFDLVKLSEGGKAMIQETFALLLEALGTEDEGFANIDELLGDAI